MGSWIRRFSPVAGFFAADVVRRLAAVLVAVALSLVVMGISAKQDHFSETGDQGRDIAVVESGAAPDSGVTPASAASSRPNILIITTDDMDERSMENFPEIQREIGAGGGLGSGATFQNAYVTHSLCCPSRASMLTGMYSHNHRVRGNGASFGGLEDFRREGHEDRGIAAIPNDGGYHTVFAGKYLNGYAGGYVPKGWDRWYGYQGMYTKDRIEFFENGREVRYNPTGNLDTYVIRDKAVEEIRTSGDRPFFMWLSFNAPHGPSLYPDKYADDFPDVRVPRVPSIGEKELGDKPRWVRQHAGYSPEDKKHRLRLRSMLAVSESVTDVMRTLARTGELANTYVVFTSDNGFRLGEHGLSEGKKAAYEEDVSVPLYVRGPGVQAGAFYEQFALNTDLAPTFAKWAMVEPPPDMDGRSLAPLFADAAIPWRTAFLVEHWQDRAGAAPYIPSYKAVHTQDAVYTRYATGEKEMYELDEDPYQLNGSVRNQSLASTLQARLAALEGCAGNTCRTAEDGQ
ncbi:MAG: sulfatase family protein [Rubrobacteraceae bacterium]